MIPLRQQRVAALHRGLLAHFARPRNLCARALLLLSTLPVRDQQPRAYALSCCKRGSATFWRQSVAGDEFKRGTALRAPRALRAALERGDEAKSRRQARQHPVTPLFTRRRRQRNLQVRAAQEELGKKGRFEGSVMNCRLPRPSLSAPARRRPRRRAAAAASAPPRTRPGVFSCRSRVCPSGSDERRELVLGRACVRTTVRHMV